MEAELFTLQDSNAKLVEALQEANSSVEQWKKQLAEYQEETDRLRDQVTMCSGWIKKNKYIHLEINSNVMLFIMFNTVCWDTFDLKKK